jgi:hypothetical protein
MQAISCTTPSPSSPTSPSSPSSSNFTPSSTNNNVDKKIPCEGKDSKPNEIHLLEQNQTFKSFPTSYDAGSEKSNNYIVEYDCNNTNNNNNNGSFSHNVSSSNIPPVNISLSSQNSNHLSSFYCVKGNGGTPSNSTSFGSVVGTPLNNSNSNSGFTNSNSYSSLYPTPQLSSQVPPNSVSNSASSLNNVFLSTSIPSSKTNNTENVYLKNEYNNCPNFANSSGINTTNNNNGNGSNNNNNSNVNSFKSFHNYSSPSFPSLSNSNSSFSPLAPVSFIQMGVSPSTSFYYNYNSQINSNFSAPRNDGSALPNCNGEVSNFGKNMQNYNGTTSVVPYVNYSSNSSSIGMPIIPVYSNPSTPSKYPPLSTGFSPSSSSHLHYSSQMNRNNQNSSQQLSVQNSNIMPAPVYQRKNCDGNSSFFPSISSLSVYSSSSLSNHEDSGSFSFNEEDNSNNNNNTILSNNLVNHNCDFIENSNIEIVNNM